ncbi:ABC transporter permease [Halomicroarcula sp. S1AR25-4]|nr:ABC transporter permease [Halomicroarcula sp. S1AR25-4]MDS0277463.1 ABC transporter permease [Halomicroarcula sp. S1AR25-4]
MTPAEDGPDTSADGGVATAPASGVAAGSVSGAGLADSPVLAIASREYRLAVRSRWAAGVALLFALFSGAVVQFGATAVGPGRFGAVVATIAELGVYLVPLAALAMGYDAVVGAHERGSLELLFALPVSKARVVAGVYLGRAGVLAGAMLLGFLPGALLTLWYVGVAGIGTYAATALAAVLTAWAMLGVAVLLSTVAAEKTHALGAALAVWLWVALLHDLVALGAVAGLDLGGRAVAAAVLLNPVDCFRVLALAQVDVVAGGFGSVLAAAGLSTPTVAGALVAWVAVPVGVAARLVRRRRL